MSTAPFEDERARPAEVAAGFLAAISLTASVIAMVYRPVRLAPFAIVVALIAVALARERHARLAAFAVALGAVGWLVGMAVAVLTGNPLY